MRRLFGMLLICSTYIAGQNPPPPSLITIYNFTGGSDGGNPSGRLVTDAGGVLYGVTSEGGANNLGTVFSLTPPASPGGSWTETVLYSFTGGADGWHPNTDLVMGSGGVLYGTTETGGFYYSGTVFAVTPPALAGGTWTLTDLHAFGDFTGSPSGLAIGSGGTLFGGTIAGGTRGYGIVYALLPPISPGGAWTEDLLYGITGSVGSALTFVMVSAGILYGTTAGGGTYGQGMIYSLAPPASPGATWTETVLHTFAGGSADGMSPWSPVVIGSGGALYGSTVGGGASNAGTIFSLTPPATSGGAWTEAVLYEFPSLHDRLPNPGPVTLGKTGVLYGTTATGGASDVGTIFALKPPASPGGPWAEVLLHTFTGSDGAEPTGGLVLGAGGILYGVTTAGGSGGQGTEFGLTE